MGYGWKAAAACLVVIGALSALALGFTRVPAGGARSVIAPEKPAAAPTTPLIAAETEPPAPAQPARPSNVYEDGTPIRYGEGWIDDSGYFFALYFTGTPADPLSLEQVRAAYTDRALRGMHFFRKLLDQMPTDQPDPNGRIAGLHRAIGGMYMYEGDFANAAKAFRAAQNAEPQMTDLLKANYDALFGMVALRRGEVENCVACCNEDSCIFPLAKGAVHRKTEGSREAVRRFTAYLDKRPDDIGVRWLLNVAYMTLGEYPDKVPKQHLIPLEPFRSRADVGRFTNVASKLGLNPTENMAGGSILDDFNGDGLIDVVTTTAHPSKSARIFINRGDGRFDDRTESSGLADQIAALNCVQADYDNDGDLDLFLMRGGWERAFRPSLMRNEGDGTFTDVTLTSGVGKPIASQAVAWGDYDNDGDVDLFVCGEYLTDTAAPAAPGMETPAPDTRNLCRLYRNDGDGSFTDVAEQAGVLNARRAKGASWGDYDADGRLDLYVSNSGQENRLYHNNGDGTFTDVARSLGVTEPIKSFSCWFFDYDNDGRLDIYCNGFYGTLNDTIRSHLGQPTEGGERPRLFHNEGPAGFHDVTREVGLDRVMLVMGSNYGDIDNDGYIDMFLGTGQPPYFYVVPKVMLKNVDGKRFEDVTLATGTGHLQKGHGISFGDWDHDGDVDVFLAAGGATLGDQAHNAMFQNPGNDNHWINVRLVGKRSNRSAIGAEIRVELPARDGRPDSRFRVISSGSSYGGNSLAPTIGLGKAKTITRLEVYWPTTRIRQTFRDVPVDRAIEIVEGENDYRDLKWSPIRLPGEESPATPSADARPDTG